MKILVTGGAGFIGSHLTERLLSEGHTVSVIDSMNDYYDVSLKEARLEKFRDRISFHKIDVADYEAVETLVKDFAPNAICHLAAQAGVRYSLEDPFSYGKSNVQGTISILEAAQKAGVTNVVIASSSSVYGETGRIPFEEGDAADRPVSVYAASKRATELIAHAYHKLYGTNIACLRFFTVYGPYGRPDMALFKFVKNMLSGEAIDVFNRGDMKRDFTYVDDIVEGFVLALTKPTGYEIYNLGHGSPIALMDFIKVLEEELGVSAKLNLLPMQAGDVPLTYADTRKAKEKLGFEAKTGIKEGVASFVKWYRSFYNV